MVEPHDYGEEQRDSCKKLSEETHQPDTISFNKSGKDGMKGKQPELEELTQYLQERVDEDVEKIKEMIQVIQPFMTEKDRKQIMNTLTIQKQ